MKVLLLSLALLTFLPGAATRTSNVLLIVLDDVGMEALALYEPGPDLPHTPTLEALAARGILFHNVWANPLCSPTRATILTGRYSFRTGVGVGTHRGDQPHNALPLTEVTLPAALDLVPYSPVHHAAFGKWHLSNDTTGGVLGPNLAGFGHFAGTLFNLRWPDHYFYWPRVVNGTPSLSTIYAVTVTVTDALDWIQRQADRPWVVYLAFTAAHAPFQAPPAALHRIPLPVPAGQTCPRHQRRPCYLAMIEALDTEIGRLLAALPPAVAQQTTVIVVGDNGTPHGVGGAWERPQRTKGTLYQGGIMVPMLIAGPAVRRPGRHSQALVNTTDLFATVFELAMGFPIQHILPPQLPLDSVSLLPLLQGTGTAVRDFAYAERFGDQESSHDGQAIRETRYKLLRFEADGREEFYNLRQDPGEQHNLLQHALTPRQQTHLTQLRARLAQLMASAEARRRHTNEKERASCGGSGSW